MLTKTDKSSLEEDARNRVEWCDEIADPIIVISELRIGGSCEALILMILAKENHSHPTNHCPEKCCRAQSVGLLD